MKNHMPLVALSLIAFVLGIASAYAQQNTHFRCGFEEYEKRYLHARGITREAIEANLQRLIAKRRQKQTINGWQLADEEVLTIPVVFHILRDEKWKNNNIIGTAYVTDEEIRNQVDTLTMHFRNKHKNRVDVIPAFKDLAVDIKVEFALAKRDPYGMPTDGTIRSGEEIGYIPPEFTSPPSPNIWDNIDLILSEWSPIWDPERYMNVYIFPFENMGASSTGSIPLNTTSGAIPSNIHGQGEATGTDITLPLITLNAYLIAREEGDSASSGYLLVHEVGHYFGLLHTFDGGCDGSDYCDDTPTQKIAANPYNIECSEITADNADINTCGTLDMTQNYMNYTNLECFRLFTPCQKERMRTVLNESYRRNHLGKSSLAITAPVAAHADSLRIIKADVLSTICPSANTYNLSAIVANFGTNTLSTYEVGVYAGNTELKKQKVTGEALATWGRDTLVLAGIARGSNPAKSQDLEVRVTLVGSKTIASDNAYIADYTLSKQLYFPTAVDADGLPLQERFESTTSKSEKWILSPEADAFARQDLKAEGNNKALMFPFHAPLDATGNKGVGAPYKIYSPILNISTPKAGHMLALRFTHSYTPDRTSGFEAIIVKGIRDACTTKPSDTLLYSTWGADLASAWFNQGDHKPDIADWRSTTVPLHSLIGDNPFQVSIEALSGGGNPIYIDDIEVVYIPESPARFNVFQRFPIYCTDFKTSVSPRAYLELDNFNAGTLPCNKKLWTRKRTPRLETYSYSLRYPDDEGDCVAPHSRLTPTNFGGSPMFSSHARFALWYDSKTPNNAVYFEVAWYDNTKAATTTISNDFSTDKEGWIAMPESHSYDANYAAHWQRTESGHLRGNFYQSGRHTNYLLTTPIVNLSGKTNPRLYFDVSYAPRTGTSERLRVMVLKSCDVYSGVVVYNKAGEALKTADATANAWVPTQDSHWRREIIDLSAYANKGPIQVVFLASDNGGNHLYLDNISIGDNQAPTNLTWDLSGNATSLTEDTPLNTKVATFSATDPEGTAITFAITAPQTHPFSLNARTGVMVLIKALDASTASSYALTVSATDAAGKVATGNYTIYVGSYLGTQELTTEDIQIYPNPSKQQLVIRLPFTPNASIQWTLMDVNGKVIDRQNQKLSTSELAVQLPKNATQSIYLLQIEGAGITTTRRIILE